MRNGQTGMKEAMTAASRAGAPGEQQTGAGAASGHRPAGTAAEAGERRAAAAAPLDARRGGEHHALLAGGGTGGHVFPALAVAEELTARGWRVSFAGSPGGLEARLVPERGIAFHGLPARPLLGRGPLARMRALATLARSAVSAASLVRRLDAAVVLGTGGYVSAPAVVGGRLAGRPVLLLEPNARAGVANRWLSRWATAAAVGYQETARGLKCPATVTGVPVRREFFAVPPISEDAGPGVAVHLLVLGGSQGARQLNRALPAAAALLAARMPELRILHQAGARNLDEARADYAAAGVAPVHAEVVAFLDDVAGAMAASQLLVCRAGAITVAEICAAGRAALLAPLAIAAGHQVDNARLLETAGGAEVLTAADLEPEPLAARLGALLGDRQKLARMGRAARALARPDAAAAIAGRLEALAAGRGRGALPSPADEQGGDAARGGDAPGSGSGGDALRTDGAPSGGGPAGGPA
jgi:UDP-N-acetylglucosamine--N-acetylmuramyl-(pentapeptide) pyrophosphoryl-undecaprenol N-acetylglucosamine transferase